MARKPDRFLGLVEAGVPLETLNVGNMSQTPETRAITRSINVVDKDVEDFHKLAEKGVKLTAQMVPNDPVSDFLSLLKIGKKFLGGHCYDTMVANFTSHFVLSLSNL